MKLKYRFNFKYQLFFGVLGFVLTLIITYLFGSVNFPLALGLGIGNFFSFGIYTDEKCK
jgi:hypothetical protein